MSIPLTGISELIVLQCDYTQNRRCFYQTLFTKTDSWINTLLAIWEIMVYFQQTGEREW